MILDLYIELHSGCNLKCAHCYNNSGISANNVIDYEFLAKYVKEIKQTNCVESVTLSGGEPLLYENLRPLIELLRFQNISVMVVTNGTLLTKEMYSFFKEFQVSLSISLDGPTQESNDKIRGTGVFQRVYNNIKAISLEDDCSDIQIKTIITRYNYFLTDEYLKLCQNLNIKKINFGFLVPTGRCNNSYKQLCLENDECSLFVDRLKSTSKQYKNIVIVYPSVTDICPIIDLSQKQTLKVASNGLILPCPIIVDHQYAIGNIYTDWPDDVLCRERYNALSAAFRNRSNNSCCKCILKKVCKAGCPVFADYNYHDINREDNCCIYRKKDF